MGNGENYKVAGEENDYDERFWFVDLVFKLRVGLNKLDKNLLLTAAIPGKEEDIALAFDKETVPALEKAIDFFNLMTYDLMNRRDNVAKHHSGGGAMLNTVNVYKEAGMTPAMMTVGFPMYAKYFEPGPSFKCDAKNPIGCEFPEFTFEMQNGTSAGNSGTFIMNPAFRTADWIGDSWRENEKRITGSWDAAQTGAVHDAAGMATSAWDATNGIFWTWLTKEDAAASCAALTKEVGGVMAW